MSIRIEQLFIKDFGIFRNQRLEDIGPGLVVIGGFNRSGKTSFMQILRYLAYGFPKTGLPAAHSKYAVEADLRLADQLYNLNLQGYGEPNIKALGEGEDFAGESYLYGLNGFTYRQLFTISLDELVALEEYGKEDRRQLQSILLGAGYKDILTLPQMAQEFTKFAEDIGGRRGDPKVKRFKVFSENIEAGQALKEEGLAQVEEYSEKQEQLKETKQTIDRLEKEKLLSKGKVGRLDVLKNNFNLYKNLSQLAEQLELDKEKDWPGGPREEEINRLESLRENYSLSKSEYQEKKFTLDLTKEEREILLQKEEELLYYLASTSGILERIRLFKERELEEKKKIQELEARLKAVKNEWSLEDTELILSFKTDGVSYNALENLVEEGESLEHKLENSQRNLVGLEAEKEASLKTCQGLEATIESYNTPQFTYSLLALGLVGIILSFFNPFLLLLPLLSGLGLLGYYIRGGRSKKELQKLLVEERTRQERLTLELEALKGLEDSLEKMLEKNKQELKEFISTLELEETLAPRALPNYLLQLRALQDQLRELSNLKREQKRGAQYLKEEYVKQEEFLSSLLPSRDSSYPSYELEMWSGLMANLKHWQNELALAKEIRALEQKFQSEWRAITDLLAKYLNEDLTFTEELLDDFLLKAKGALEFARLKEEVFNLKRQLLNAMNSDAIKGYFHLESSGEKELLEAFHNEYKAYAYQAEVETSHREELDQKEDLEASLVEARKLAQRLEDDLTRLATREKLYQGQRAIDSNREELEVLANEYAINMLASHILEEMEHNLLLAMKDGIMKGAAEIFSQMTSGEYQEVMLSKSLLEADFEALLAGTNSPQKIGMLSRGTKEQLFLAVRLSRIRDIKPALPIIIDDSLVNFDNPHLHQTLSLLADLSQSHQIFILTCHWEVLAALKELKLAAQYWQLEKGHFFTSTLKDLENYLQI